MVRPTVREVRKPCHSRRSAVSRSAAARSRLRGGLGQTLGQFGRWGRLAAKRRGRGVTWRFGGVNMEGRPGKPRARLWDGGRCPPGGGCGVGWGAAPPVRCGSPRFTGAVCHNVTHSRVSRAIPSVLAKAAGQADRLPRLVWPLWRIERYAAFAKTRSPWVLAEAEPPHKHNPPWPKQPPPPK